MNNKKPKIKYLKNKEKNKRIFILANGPSINNFDLNKLKSEIVIGMNASTILESSYDFTSSYYVMSDHRFINHPDKRQWATDKLNQKTIRVLRSDLDIFDSNDIKNTTFYIKPLSRDGFSKDLSNGYFYGCTTTMLAIQLAYYLGASEIYLLGCDLKYPVDNARFYKEEKPQLEDSFTSVQISNISNAAEFLESKNIKIYGCSPESLLRPYLPYIDFNSIL